MRKIALSGTFWDAAYVAALTGILARHNGKLSPIGVARLAAEQASAAVMVRKDSVSRKYAK